MRLVLFLLGALTVCSVAGHQDDDGDEQIVQVPQDVLRFILGCQRDTFGDPDGPLPVYHTDIDTKTGTTSQKVSLLDVDQLRASLRSSVQNEEVLDLILGKVSAEIQGATNNNNRLRHDFINRNSTSDENGGCTVNNNIEVSVPVQEIDDFNDRVQILIQQNSFLLLEQINTLFTYKLRSLREDFENMVRDRTKKIHRKIDAVLKALNIEAPPGTEEEEPSSVSELEKPSVIESEEPSSSSESTTDSSEVESYTDSPNEMDDHSQEEDTTDKTPEDTSAELKEELANIRKNIAPRPVLVPTTIHNRRRPVNRPISRPGFRKTRPTSTRYESTTKQRPTRYESPSNTDGSKQRRTHLRYRFMSRKPVAAKTEVTEE